MTKPPKTRLAGATSPAGTAPRAPPAEITEWLIYHRPTGATITSRGQTAWQAVARTKLAWSDCLAALTLTELEQRKQECVFTMTESPPSESAPSEIQLIQKAVQVLENTSNAIMTISETLCGLTEQVVSLRNQMNAVVHHIMPDVDSDDSFDENEPHDTLPPPDFQPEKDSPTREDFPIGRVFTVTSPIKSNPSVTTNESNPSVKTIDPKIVEWLQDQLRTAKALECTAINVPLHTVKTILDILNNERT